MQKPLLIILLSLLFLGVLTFFVAKNIVGSRYSCGYVDFTIPTSDYKNISYNIEGQDILLNEGYNEHYITEGSQSKQITKYFGNEATSDLNNDGKDDVVFLITQDNGGSGTFYYVVATISSDNGYQGTNAMLLGDRIAPQTTEIHDGVIVVNYADRMEDEAMTDSPSLGVSKYFVVEGYNLKEKL